MIEDSIGKDICCLRKGLIGELETINEYRKLQHEAEDPRVKAIFASIINEEKIHCGEFTEAIHTLCGFTKDLEEKGEREARNIIESVTKLKPMI